MRAVGGEMADQARTQMVEQLEAFRNHLQTFAVKHKDEINRNPHFRKQFMQMCQTTGVDPLSSGKSYWGRLLGVNDFYYELAVQAVDVCLRQRHKSGGLLKLSYLHQALSDIRGRYSQQISMDDVQRAIGTLGVLGTGYKIVEVWQANSYHGLTHMGSVKRAGADSVCPV